MIFKKRHTTVKAIQWTGHNLEEVKAFLNHNGVRFFQNGALFLMATANGDVTAGLKDWIVVDQGKISVSHEKEFPLDYEPEKKKTTEAL